MTQGETGDGLQAASLAKGADEEPGFVWIGSLKSVFEGLLRHEAFGEAVFEPMAEVLVGRAEAGEEGGGQPLEDGMDQICGEHGNPLGGVEGGARYSKKVQFVVEVGGEIKVLDRKSANQLMG